MRVIAAFLCVLTGCSAQGWIARAGGPVGIEDHFKGCSTRMVFVPAEGLEKWVPEGYRVKEPGRAGVAGFDCRYSQMEQGPVSFAMVVVMIEKPDKVFDPGLVDVYEVARVTSGKKHKEMLQALGYRIEKGNEMFPHTAWALRGYELKGMHVRVWHKNVYTLMHFKEHTSSIGAVSNCKIEEGSLIHEIAGTSVCSGGSAQTAAGVDFSVLIRI
jgi:hypothetical protein